MHVMHLDLTTCIDVPMLTSSARRRVCTWFRPRVRDFEEENCTVVSQVAELYDVERSHVRSEMSYRELHTAEVRFHRWVRCRDEDV